MIEFIAFHLDNFAGYKNTTVTFSTEEGRPLTLIRGENMSGKTTMLRGLTWIVYGMDAMPKAKGGTHPVRPDFLEDGEAVHSGQVVFAHEATGGNRALFRLRREAVTKATGPQVVVLSESQYLERHRTGDWHDDTAWEDASGQLLTLRRGYFKPELREIIFADADKAEEFVGGPEQSHSDELMERSVTGALNRLLGIDIIDAAIGRTEGVRKYFRAELDKKSDQTSDLPEMRDELEKESARLDRLTDELKTMFIGVERAREGIAKIELEKDKVRADSDKTAVLQAEVANLRVEATKQRHAAEQYLGNVIERFHNETLPAVLMSAAIVRASNHLGGLKEEGVLPPSEVSVIPKLLRSGTCLCHTDVSKGTEARKHLEDLLEESREYAEGRSTLDEFRMQLGGLVGRAQALGGAWRDRLDELVVGCAKADAESRRIEGIIAAKTQEMDDLSKGNERYQELDELLGQHQRDLANFHNNIAQHEAILGSRFAYDPDARKMTRLTTPEEHLEWGKDPINEVVRKNGLIYRVESLRKTIATREKTEVKADLERTQLKFAEDVRRVLGDVLTAIRDEQVPEVSTTMNEIYRDVMQAGSDSQTAEVGIRPTSHGYADRQYELFAKNQRGYDKPMGLLAGSERRAVSTAFLLALVKTSGTRVPFVSDSLLHAVSGVVRTNLIKRVVTEASQSVMFAIRSDLADATDRELLLDAAGRTYTITNQAHVPEKVVRRTESQSGSLSVLCTCGPDEFCDICERVEDAESARLKRSHDSELVN